MYRTPIGVPNKVDGESKFILFIFFFRFFFYFARESVWIFGYPALYVTCKRFSASP